MKKTIGLFIVIFSLAFASATYADDLHPEEIQSRAQVGADGVKYLPREPLTIQTAAGQDYIFDVEMATAMQDQADGLMNRPTLSNDSGMLFLFTSEQKPDFWMKDTLIPLDMIFIARDGTINHIHHNARPLDETRITTDKPALAVLEINGGAAGTLGIKEGDKVLHPAFRNVRPKSN